MKQVEKVLQLEPKLKLQVMQVAVVDLSDGIIALKAEDTSEIFIRRQRFKNLITFRGDISYTGSVGPRDLAYLNAAAARQQVAEDGNAVRCFN